VELLQRNSKDYDKSTFTGFSSNYGLQCKARPTDRHYGLSGSPMTTMRAIGGGISRRRRRRSSSRRHDEALPEGRGVRGTAVGGGRRA